MSDILIGVIVFGLVFGAAIFGMYLKNAYANLAWGAGDRVRLSKLLAEVKSNPDMNIWVNLENVALAEKFAAANAGR